MFMYFWSELRTAWKDTSTYGPYINKNTHPAHLHIVNVDKSAQKKVLSGYWQGFDMDRYLIYATVQIAKMLRKYAHCMLETLP